MPSTKMITASVLERFPDDWHVIVELCRENEDFRELCDHYAECTVVLARLRAAREPESCRVVEYEDLTKELEQEIRNSVDTRLGLKAQETGRAAAPYVPSPTRGRELG